MTVSLTEPIKLEMARAWRTYTGGSSIRALHGEEGTPDDHFPEEWIMSTVRARNAGREEIVEGITMLSDAPLSLRELIDASPEETLGEAHYRKYGAELGVLVKLIDAAERLTVQVHPTRDMARTLFDSAYGKTECWHILGGRPIGGEEPSIYFGFRPGITREYWMDCFRRQDIPAMLACLHKFPVKPGDTYLIEGGIPHAIGAGCFLVEIQEPTDYSVRTERTTPQGLRVPDFMCHQGLGFDRMFDCFAYRGYSEEETRARWKIERRGDVILGKDSTEMFSLGAKEVDGKEYVACGGSFLGLYILEGEGLLNGRPVKTGDQFFVPAACPGFTVEGKLKLFSYTGPTA